MKIKYDSWHRKFNRWAWGEYVLSKIDRNLCSYFWATLFAMLVSPLILLGKTIIFIATHIHIEIPIISDKTMDKISSIIGHICLAGSLIGYILLCIYFGFDVIYWTLIGIGVAGVSLFLGFVVTYAREKYRENHPKKYREREPNMLVEWAKAKKDKNCPILEWN